MTKAKLSAEEVASILKKNVDEKRMVDINPGVEELFGIGKPRFQSALGILRKQGYQILLRATTQKSTGAKTVLKVLAAPKVSYKDLFDYKIFPVENK